MMTILAACLCCLTAAGWMTDGGISIWEWDVGSSCVWCCDLASSLHTLACSSGNLTLCTWPHDFALFRYYLFARWATMNIFIRSERNPNNEIGPLYHFGPQTHNSAVKDINSPRHITKKRAQNPSNWFPSQDTNPTTTSSTQQLAVAQLAKDGNSVPSRPR